MAAKTDFLEQKVLDHLFGLATWTAPAGLWVGLLTAAADEDGTPTNEATYAGYARVQPAGTTKWVRVGSVVSNNGVITHPICTAGSQTVVGVGIWDAETAGNLLLHGTLDVPIGVSSGITVQWAVGALDIEEQ